MKTNFCQEIVQHLTSREERLVLAESCTSGMIAAKLGQIPGVSACLCGSAVVYQPKTKKSWLHVRQRTIKTHTTESAAVASEMAKGVLLKTPDADWAVAIVGHLGPDAPKDKDGNVFICLARRTKKGRIKVKETIEYQLKSNTRDKRQDEATEAALSAFARLLLKKADSDNHKNNGVVAKVPATV